MNEAIKENLEQYAGQIEKITKSIEAADRGELIAHDDVMGEMESLIANKTQGNL